MKKTSIFNLVGAVLAMSVSYTALADEFSVSTGSRPISAGLGILYSASDGSVDLVQRQVVRLAIAFAVMFIVAQIPQHQLYVWAP